MTEPATSPVGEDAVLGRTVRSAVSALDTFTAPAHVEEVVFVTDELTSLCPVTEQPDLSTVRIAYQPASKCIESKSLKLYLWGFRDRGVFAEALAAEIASRVFTDAEPLWVEVTLQQSVRGGIVTTARARRGQS